MPNKKLYLSATAITDFLGCPHKFKLRSLWGIKEPIDNLGLRVHRAMQDDKEPSDSTARRLYRQLNVLLRDNGILIRDREKKYIDQIDKDVIFTRVLDVIGERKGIPVIVDYKTANWPWDIVDGVVPQARTIQAAAYLMPLKEKKWPTTLFFLVVNNNTSPQTFIYHHSTKDEKNLLDAVDLIRFAYRENCFPHNEGKLCKWCDWSGVCFKVDGWEKKYIKRKDRA